MVTIYEPESYTKFGSAIITAYSKTPEDATYADFDKLLVEKGSYTHSTYVGGKSVKMNIVPQIVSYGKDFSGYRKFR